MRYPLGQMLPSVLLRAFAWAFLVLPALAAIVFFFQDPLLALANLQGSLELPLTPEILIFAGFGGLLAWALLLGFALIVESAAATARNSQVTLELLKQVRDALGTAVAAEPEAAEVVDKEEAVEVEKPKTPLTFDNW